MGGKSARQYKTPDDGKNIGKQYLEQMHSYIIHTKIEEIWQKNKTELKTSNTRNIKTKPRNTHQSHACYSYFSTAKTKVEDT